MVLCSTVLLRFAIKTEFDVQLFVEALGCVCCDRRLRNKHIQYIQVYVYLRNMYLGPILDSGKSKLAFSTLVCSPFLVAEK